MLLLLLVGLVGFSACGDRDLPPRSTQIRATPTYSLTPTGDPDEVVLDRTPFPPGTATGMAPLDSLIAAITSRDLDAISSLTRFARRPCLELAVGGLAEACEEGESVGTSVKLFGVEMCSGGFFVRRAEVRGVLRPLAEWGHRLVGVVELQLDRPSKGPVPIREPAYVIVLSSNSEPPSSTVVHADPRGMITGISYACFGVHPQRMLEAWANGNRQVFP